MTKANVIIGIALTAITACLVYLFTSGISLRFARLIKPSTVIDQGEQAAEAVILRMFAELSEHNVLIISVPHENSETSKLVEFLKSSYQRQFKKTPQVVESVLQLQNCTGPCWWVDSRILSSLGEELPELKALNKNYLVIYDYLQNTQPSQKCKSMQRLDWACLRDLSIHQASRKIKTTDRHFFLNKYKDDNFFWFIGKI